MSNGDVEMEDAVKHTHDTGNCVQESEDKLHDGRVESEEVNYPPATAVTDDAHKSENGREDPLRNETEDKNSVNSKLESQINPKSEANEPINPEGESIEEITTKSENEELINTKTKAEEQIAIRSVVEEQTDAINEMAEQNPTNGGQEKSTEKVMDSGNPVNLLMEENEREDIADKKSEEIGREDAAPVEYVAVEEKTPVIVGNENHSSKNMQLSNKVSADDTPQSPKATLDEVPQDEDEKMEDVAHVYEAKEVKDEIEQCKDIAVTDETEAKHAGDDDSFQNHQEPVTPNSLVNFSSAKAGDNTGETLKTGYTQATLPLMAESDDGTPEEQTAFMKEVESFYRERAMDFKPPKFYGQPLNCLKLWRAVIRLGGYDRVTGAKLWRQVGESFHPPKTCTTVSWTFRIFYEKSLLEYERHKTQSGELQLPVATLPEASGVDGEGNGYQGSGSGPGRARRDAAARAMQGWHAQRLSGCGEVGEPIMKDKTLNNMTKREKTLKSIGSLKQKRPNDVEHSVKAARAETSKQLVTSVVDIGPPADWVKINVRQTKDCFEVYALVPGLLREEVRVQSDPAGRLVITGQPEQVDNPWGITPFKKVVSLPGRIDPLQTSAVVSLHGRLFVRVPFEQSNI